MGELENKTTPKLTSNTSFVNTKGKYKIGQMFNRPIVAGDQNLVEQDEIYARMNPDNTVNDLVDSEGNSTISGGGSSPEFTLEISFQATPEPSSDLVFNSIGVQKSYKPEDIMNFYSLSEMYDAGNGDIVIQITTAGLAYGFALDKQTMHYAFWDKRAGTKLDQINEDFTLRIKNINKLQSSSDYHDPFDFVSIWGVIDFFMNMG